MRKLLFIGIALIVSGSVFSAKLRFENNETKNKYDAVYETQNKIDNSFLVVSYNPKSKNLEVAYKSNGKTFLKNVIPNGTIKTVTNKKMVSPIFGNGNALVVSAIDGGEFSFSLYPSVPFLFVTQTVKNNGKDILDIQKLNPVVFSVDLQKQATQLKTLGTGGLLEADKNPGSYVFLTTVDPSTRNGVVAGWLTNEKGSGVLFSGIDKNLVEIKAQIDYGHLRIPTGKSEVAETLVIGYFDDARLGEEQFANLLAKQNKIKLRERSAVYCSWYSEKNGGAGSEASTIELAKFASSKLKPYGLGVIQLDDEWQDGGHYNGPRRGFDRVNPKGGYPNGMSATAKAIKDSGFSAGIWWMPFSRNHQDPEYKDRQNWFAYRTNGKPYETKWGGTSLDLTNPEVQNHVSYVAKTLQGWGYDYFKMDGLYTGTVTEQVYINDGYKNDSIGNYKLLYDPSISQIQAFRNGLKLIRKATDGKVFLSGCCVSQNMRSFGASIGLVDAMRIGPDYNHDGQSIRTGPIRASRLYFLNGRIWWNDPDPSVLREKGASTADGGCTGIGALSRARLLPSFVAVSGQFFLSSDWLPDLPNDRLEIMKRCMESHTGIARPVDGFEKALPSVWLASDSKSGTERNVIGLYNWDLTPQKIECKTAWIGLKDKTDYYAFDFWENKPINDISSVVSEELPAESCKVIAVRAKTNHPIVVSTSQHVTQGMIDLVEEEWKGNSLSGSSKIIGGDTYELRIAGLNDGANWKVDTAKLIGNPKNTSIEVLPQTEKGWLRVVIKSSESQVVKWELRFKK
ncbi:glycoside hydrolase family 36 protein [Flavobacterium gilvum]|uniref:Alpha-galactosidase n=1 Tax=Flavobacterium gilvum TaxID=1492737 RepID=A0AAC9I505_9FLAO|nr:glycoside hydrolase family 36 protein [Flavobacterium gilvum]AOW10549.1 hypothetical protein EM308_14155 [Flavobacterium gilvum]KFC59585.1 hypothetical protein FEM08_16340 [Flavobacterium gilvum]